MIRADVVVDHRRPVETDAHEAARPRGAVHAERRRAVALFLRGTARQHGRAVERNQHRDAAAVAVQIAAVDLQACVRERHAGRHRQIQFLAGVRRAQHERIAHAEFGQRYAAARETAVAELREAAGDLGGLLCMSTAREQQQPGERAQPEAWDAGLAAIAGLDSQLGSEHHVVLTRIGQRPAKPGLPGVG
ncbi:hypothetical protein ABIE53_001713 [Burkholderia sp. OAS925]|uniref:hypothetical protein n=1 Tax=Paraburkholderia sp. OAS925 TaxID=2663827 RepID=UPI003470099A